MSHEYHYLSDGKPRSSTDLIVAGEDVLYLCPDCGFSKNSELIGKELSSTCPSCKHDSLKTRTSIELGHTFYLGTKYTSVFKAQYMPRDDPSALRTPQMGCYGLGISRIISAIVEVSHDADGMIWPASVAPWKCIVVLPKEGVVGGDTLYDRLASILGSDNVLMDDRPNLSMGWKLKDAMKVGYPFIVGLGHKWEKERLAEFINRRTGETSFKHKSEVGNPKFWQKLSI